MNWVSVFSWAYGFFAPVAVLIVIALAIMGIVGIVNGPQFWSFDVSDVWRGVWLCVGVSIAAGAIASMFIV